MNKKITAAVLLIIFVSLNVSCSSTYLKKIRLQEGKPWKISNPNIQTVYTKSRLLVEFDKKVPAKVFDGTIHGLTEDETGEKKFVSIPISEAEVIWIKKRDAGSTLVFILMGVGGLCILLLKSL